MRLRVLTTNGGGIWMDAACVMFRPIDAWMCLRTDAAVIGYAYPHCAQARILESWAIFAPRGAPFLPAWFAEFDHAVRRGLSRYVDDVRVSGELPPPGLNLPYHALSVAGWVVPMALIHVCHVGDATTSQTGVCVHSTGARYASGSSTSAMLIPPVHWAPWLPVNRATHASVRCLHRMAVATRTHAMALPATPALRSNRAPGVWQHLCEDNQRCVACFR